MTIVAVNLAQSVFDQIKNLVDQALYSSPEAFLEIAAFNQLALERGISPTDLINRGHRISAGTKTSRLRCDPSFASQVPDEQAAREQPKPTARPVGRRKSIINSPASADISETMDRLSLTKLVGNIPPTVSTTKRLSDERLWGQVNRLFPIKLACRWIAVANEGLTTWLNIDNIGESLANDAAVLGSHLEKLDVAAKRKRDDALATGLPRRGNIPSRDRFLSQFVARATRAGDIYPGAICQYALASFDDDQLAISHDGLHLARLENPIIDHLGTGPRSSLSSAERDFFLRQIHSYVPSELRDFGIIIRALSAGSNTPESLIASTRDHFPSEWSPMMIRTHVSGIVARLTDLGLIERKWEGRHVSYLVNSIPSGFLPQEGDLL